MIAASGGTMAPVRDGLEHVFQVVTGTLVVGAVGREEILTGGGYAYAPDGDAVAVGAADRPAEAIWIKRPYQPATSQPAPRALIGRWDRVERRLKHTDGRAWQHFLSDRDLGLDMAVNIFSFALGTHFPFVETHNIEHGLYMLQGQGLYLLGREWHECRTGDFVWTGSYVPQQFYRTGWEEGAYLSYEDVDRDVRFEPAGR